MVDPTYQQHVLKIEHRTFNAGRKVARCTGRSDLIYQQKETGSWYRLALWSRSRSCSIESERDSYQQKSLPKSQATIVTWLCSVKGYSKFPINC